MGSWSIFGAEDAYKREYATFLTYNRLAFKKWRLGCIDSGSKTDGMALYYLP